MRSGPPHHPGNKLEVQSLVSATPPKLPRQNLWGEALQSVSERGDEGEWLKSFKHMPLTGGYRSKQVKQVGDYPR